MSLDDMIDSNVTDMHSNKPVMTLSSSKRKGKNSMHTKIGRVLYVQEETNKWLKQVKKQSALQNRTQYSCEHAQRPQQLQQGNLDTPPLCGRDPIPTPIPFYPTHGLRYECTYCRKPFLFQHAQQEQQEQHAEKQTGAAVSEWAVRAHVRHVRANVKVNAFRKTFYAILQ